MYFYDSEQRWEIATPEQRKAAVDLAGDVPDFDAALAAAGYSTSPTRFGEDEFDPFCVEVYRRQRQAGSEFLVAVMVAGRFDFVIVTELSALLALLREVVPVAEAAVRFHDRKERQDAEANEWIRKDKAAGRLK